MKKPRKPKLKSIGQLKETADRKVQDFHRATRPDRKCEMCNGPYEVIHHFVPKSSSNYLRYVEKNFVYICHGCHFLFHKPDPLISIRLAIKRGPEWVEYIETHRRKLKDDKRLEIMEIIERHTL